MMTMDDEDEARFVAFQEIVGKAWRRIFALEKRLDELERRHEREDEYVREQAEH